MVWYFSCMGLAVVSPHLIYKNVFICLSLLIWKTKTKTKKQALYFFPDTHEQQLANLYDLLSIVEHKSRLFLFFFFFFYQLFLSIQRKSFFKITYSVFHKLILSLYRRTVYRWVSKLTDMVKKPQNLNFDCCINFDSETCRLNYCKSDKIRTHEVWQHLW